jgi:hypothetical protein
MLEKTTWLPICFAPDALLMLVCRSCDNIYSKQLEPDPPLLIIDVVYIMTPLVASEKHPSVDRLGKVGSGTGKQETDDETKEPEDGTEDLDDKNLDEPV